MDQNSLSTRPRLGFHRMPTLGEVMRESSGYQVRKVYRIQWTEDEDPREISALFVETNDPEPGHGTFHQILSAEWPQGPPVYQEWGRFPDPDGRKKLVQKDHIGYAPAAFGWLGTLSKAIHDPKHPLGADYPDDAEGRIGRNSALGPKISTLRREDVFRVVGQEGREAECKCRCTCGKNVRWEDEVEGARPERLLLANALLVLADAKLFHKGRFPEPYRALKAR